MNKRISVTENAMKVIQQLKDEYGELMFHQSGAVVKAPIHIVLRKVAF
ncbi:hypothetical protein ABDJ41_21620 [Pedobacter sp. ASV1-7]